MTSRSLLNWIELSRAALDHNVRSLVRLAGKRMIAVSVKANAYGHGLPEIISYLNDHPEVGYVTVHSWEEAALCRDSGWDRRIMLLGPVPLHNLEAVFEFDLEPVVFTREALSGLGKLADKWKTPLRTHLKLETGTNRQGITEKELGSFAAIYRKHEYLRKPYGAGMHFANIEDTTNHEYAQHQLDRFNRMVARMKALGIGPSVRHTASSAALILFEKTRFELVRPGIAFYGHWPSKETYLSYRLAGGHNDLLRPVLSWHTRVTQLKDVPADSFIGYGCTYRTTSRTRLAVLPAGYADGYDRSLSNLAYVLIRGRRAPVRGRICMNLTMVDVTDIAGVRLEDPVILLGSQKKDVISAEQMAGWAASINYEILARISPYSPRLLTPK
ncbi:MAG: alanine racemase [Candidatus Zixiibacteriota bacterium]